MVSFVPSDVGHRKVPVADTPRTQLVEYVAVLNAASDTSMSAKLLQPSNIRYTQYVLPSAVAASLTFVRPVQLRNISLQALAGKEAVVMIGASVRAVQPLNIE